MKNFLALNLFLACFTISAHQDIFTVTFNFSDDTTSTFTAMRILQADAEQLLATAEHEDLRSLNVTHGSTFTMNNITYIVDDPEALKMLTVNFAIYADFEDQKTYDATKKSVLENTITELLNNSEKSPVHVAIKANDEIVGDFTIHYISSLQAQEIVSIRNDQSEKDSQEPVFYIDNNLYIINDQTNPADQIKVHFSLKIDVSSQDRHQ
jgi:hypothetical protein